MLQTYRALKRSGVIGVNERNVRYVSALNQRKLLVNVDDKLVTKDLAESVNIPTPSLYGVIANARAHSIPILFVLPAANLLQSPRAPEHASGFVAQEAFETLMAKGQRAAREGDFAEALSQFDRGVALSPGHALGHFARGMTLVPMGETKLARTAFQRALDLDHWTHRITSRLEKILLGAGYEQNVPVVDLRPIFQRDLSNERIESLFVDHVHPTAKGHEQIAEIMRPEVGRLLGLAQFQGRSPQP